MIASALLHATIAHPAKAVGPAVIAALRAIVPRGIAIAGRPIATVRRSTVIVDRQIAIAGLSNVPLLIAIVRPSIVDRMTAAVVIDRDPRPLLAVPAFDGMDLGPALIEAFGALPEAATIQRLKGDASTRSYYRLDVPGQAPVIVMRLPADALSADEGTSDPRPAELPFINMQRHLLARGVPVPRVLVDHTSRGVLLLEDLGDETFEARLRKHEPAGWRELYAQAVDVMAAMHRACAEHDSACVAYGRSFDRKLLRWELEHFREWGLEALGITLSDAQRGELERSFDLLVDQVLALPQGFVHRDYQSRNLMWALGDALVVIDFQDALQGPAVYDLVALMCDSYVDLDHPLQLAMITHLAELRGESAAALERAFWLVTVQRKLKDAGRFVFIDQVRGNPDFLPWYAPSLRYVGRALSHLPELAPLATLLREHIPGFPDEGAQPPAQTFAHRGRAL